MKSFFFTIQQTINAFKRPHAGGDPNQLDPEDLYIKKSEALARIAITFALIFVVLYLFRHNNSNNNYSEIASVMAGTIFGYWFR